MSIADQGKFSGAQNDALARTCNVMITILAACATSATLAALVTACHT
jgi:hypothetical protein